MEATCNNVMDSLAFCLVISRAWPTRWEGCYMCVCVFYVVECATYYLICSMWQVACERTNAHHFGVGLSVYIIVLTRLETRTERDAAAMRQRATRGQNSFLIQNPNLRMFASCVLNLLSPLRAPPPFPP